MQQPHRFSSPRAPRQTPRAQVQPQQPAAQPAPQQQPPDAAAPPQPRSDQPPPPWASPPGMSPEDKAVYQLSHFDHLPGEAQPLCQAFQTLAQYIMDNVPQSETRETALKRLLSLRMVLAG